MIALGGFAQQHQVVGAAHSRFQIGSLLSTVAAGFVAPVMPAAFGDVHFAADDRLYVPFSGFVKEIRGCEQVAVVGDGHRRHFLPRGFVQELGRFAGPVQQAEIRMDVKMYELRLPHGTRF